ncbi:membrane-bound lytic murein transglycosylase B [Pseudoxanthomonas sp. GM95]|uniref:lytic murein transglycosylase B n=1 Tax=Pseudoxanthomonas sp. GM95 TaxID=1881043 RepID=UPI0008C7A49D|nr:lytic murein transglycosylase B [Pseudoxanthomonas sp. GM95]SEK52930.1 membrane-bound lytic murein transglycosylase B [Pseudoxanthomonas sp. GM95]
MIRRALACLFTLGLVACATQPKPSTPPKQTVQQPAPTRPPVPVPGGKPAETAVEQRADAQLLDLTPVPFEVSRANFIRDTAARFQLDPAWIEATLAHANWREDTIKLMSKPAERTIGWSEYRPRFITESRISGGQKFLATHRAELMRVQERTGVPAEIIVAILGVETSYGGYTGKTPIVDALYTLAFRYPRTGDPARAQYEARRELFFRDELAQLFALSKEQNLDLTTLTGSYAGAMGLGQFMPSSYRDFGVDGDGDGRINLLTDFDDIFSSVANYFVKKGGAYGWERGGPVAVQATLAPGKAAFDPLDWTPTWTQADLAARGYTALAPVPPGETATPVTLAASNGPQYWLGFRNYYAITRYNNSKMYAMAVWQLSEAIAGRPLPPA